MLVLFPILKCEHNLECQKYLNFIVRLLGNHFLLIDGRIGGLALRFQQHVCSSRSLSAQGIKM